MWPTTNWEDKETVCMWPTTNWEDKETVCMWAAVMNPSFFLKFP